jgi:hypothetical protein
VCAARAAAPGEAPVSAQSSGGALRRRARKLSVSDCMRARTAAGRLSPRRVPGIQARGDALRVPSAARAFPEPLHAMGSLARWLAAGCCAYGMRLALAACPRLSSAQKSTYESSWTKSMCRVVCARALACVRVPPAELGGDAVCVCVCEYAQQWRAIHRVRRVAQPSAWRSTVGQPSRQAASAS